MLFRRTEVSSDKIDTFILDFVNNEEDIRNFFQPFYKGNILDERLNVNLVYDSVNDLKAYHLWNEDKAYQVLSIVQDENSFLKLTVDEFDALESECQIGDF